MIDVYGPLNGASALAANGVARYGLGAAFPLFTFQMYENLGSVLMMSWTPADRQQRYEKLGIDWATSLLGFISIAVSAVHT